MKKWMMLVALVLIAVATAAPYYPQVAPPTAQYWTGAPDSILTAEKDLSALSTGLVLNTAGTPSAYAGTSCLNQFPRSLNASGAATCASVSLTLDVSGILPLTAGGGLTTALDDTVAVGNGTIPISTLIPTCSGGVDALTYNIATNTFGCNTLINQAYATIQDEGTPKTQRSIVNFAGAGVSCVDNVVDGRTDCTVTGGGGGGGNFVAATVDFGSSGNTNASVVVTGQAWVTSSSTIVCNPTMFLTTDRADGDEDAAIEGLAVAVSTRVVGTGFTVHAAPKEGAAIGKFLVHCTGA